VDVDCLLREAESTPTGGWDFARFGARLRSLPRPWNFAEIVSAHARSAAAMLDLGTGGGEWLAALDRRAARTVATESWPPNVVVAERRLRAMGIAVVATESAPNNTEQVRGVRGGTLPFADEEFDLVTSRHESYLPVEVGRVLAGDGIFLTQQTGGDYAGFYELLGLEPPLAREPRWTLTYATKQLEDAAFHVVDGAESAETVVFQDVGVVAWYLRAIPWVIPSFTIERFRAELEALQARIERAGEVAVEQPTFWLKAVRRGTVPGSITGTVTSA
jgi:SAM-dependent methyltransferase